jgi:hypothetical protein
MARLTKRQQLFDITKYLPEDMSSTQATERQIKDPITGTVHAPGLTVGEDGTVTFKDDYLCWGCREGFCKRAFGLDENKIGCACCMKNHK